MRKSTYVKITRKVIIEKSTDSNELFKLTVKYTGNKKSKDGKCRSFILYFLNDVLILKQKRPFDETQNVRFNSKVWISNEYLLGGNLHQERRDNLLVNRFVKYPISKTKLEALNVPSDLKIKLSK